MRHFSPAKSSYAWILTLLLVSLVTTNAVAAPGLLIPAPAETSLINERSAAARDYRLALGSMKKANGDWFVEHDQRIEGDLQQVTLELDRNLSVAEVEAGYRQQLQQLGAEMLFSCKGRDCGSSSGWADEHFRVSQLYGSDQSQFYSAWRVPAVAGEGASQRAEYYVAIYCVTRGNRRSYLQYEQIQAQAKAAVASAAGRGAVADELQAGRSLIYLPMNGGGSAFHVTPEQVTDLSAGLRQNPALQVVLVGHNYDAGTLQQQIEKSAAQATDLRQQLITAGAPAAQLQVEGVGSLAPGVTGDRRNRVEAVIAPD